MKKLSVDNLLRQALHDAILYQSTFLDAIANCADEEDEQVRKETTELIFQYRQYYKRRFINKA